VRPARRVHSELERLYLTALHLARSRRSPRDATPESSAHQTPSLSPAELQLVTHHSSSGGGAHPVGVHMLRRTQSASAPVGGLKYSHMTHLGGAGVQDSSDDDSDDSDDSDSDDGETADGGGRAEEPLPRAAGARLLSRPREPATARLAAADVVHDELFFRCFALLAETALLAKWRSPLLAAARAPGGVEPPPLGLNSPDALLGFHPVESLPDLGGFALDAAAAGPACVATTPGAPFGFGAGWRGQPSRAGVAGRSASREGTDEVAVAKSGGAVADGAGAGGVEGVGGGGTPAAFQRTAGGYVPPHLRKR
jgi:hypothetical protein